MKTPKLTAARLRELLHYDPEIGIFTWRAMRGGEMPGSRAGYVIGNGYRQICIDRERLYEHRLAWLYVMGEWPSDEIDHADCDRTNNRLQNLRSATKSQNRANRPTQSNNTSGAKGVLWNGQREKWMAVIKRHRKTRYLGLFNTVEDAAAAYAKAANEAFGDFARTA